MPVFLSIAGGDGYKRSTPKSAVASQAPVKDCCQNGGRTDKVLSV